MGTQLGWPRHPCLLDYHRYRHRASLYLVRTQGFAPLRWQILSLPLLPQFTKLFMIENA